MKEHRGENEGIRALEEIVCQAIPDPSLAAKEKSGSQEDPTKKEPEKKPKESDSDSSENPEGK